MKHRILPTIIAAIACITASAQSTCIINGAIADNDIKVKIVSLIRTDALGQETTVATAKVKRGKYTLTYQLAQDEPALQYTIKGVGEGIPLFVEPGEVFVATASASQYRQSTVTGTPTNDTYAEYKAILENGRHEAETKVAALESQHGQQWMESTEGKIAVKRIEAQEAIKTESQVLRFLIDHNASPMTPLVAERTLLPKLSEAYAGQILNAISTTLHTHPYYLSLRNSVLASNMKVGNELPDIALPLLTGDTKQLSDYRGRYVVLHFWKSDCEQSVAALAELKHLHEIINENQDQFVIISIALDTDKAAWKAAVENHGIAHDGWLHACDGAGAASPAAKLYGVEKTPRLVVVEPEGLAVSLNMDIDEVVMRTEQILLGDLYYLDQKE